MRSCHRRRWRRIRICVSYAHSTLFPAMVRWCTGALSPLPPPVPRATHARTHPHRRRSLCISAGALVGSIQHEARGWRELRRWRRGEARCWMGDEQRAASSLEVIFGDAGCYPEASVRLLGVRYLVLPGAVRFAMYVLSLVVWGRATRGRHDTKLCFVSA
jgi:hypothetical protein